MIEDLTNYDLVRSFEDAVRDSHYNPTNEEYNESGFSKAQLRHEILRRLIP